MTLDYALFDTVRRGFLVFGSLLCFWIMASATTSKHPMFHYERGAARHHSRRRSARRRIARSARRRVARSARREDPRGAQVLPEPDVLRVGRRALVPVRGRAGPLVRFVSPSAARGSISRSIIDRPPAQVRGGRRDRAARGPRRSLQRARAPRAARAALADVHGRDRGLRDVFGRAATKLHGAFKMHFLYAQRGAGVFLIISAKFWRNLRPACRVAGYRTGRRTSTRRSTSTTGPSAGRARLIAAPRPARASAATSSARRCSCPLAARTCLRRIAATPRLPRGYFSNESRRRRGGHVDIPRRQGRGDAAAAARIFGRSRPARASGTSSSRRTR